jgi:aryl-alcohol dehydrogenase-like predicted oxidoreductase
MTSKTAPYMIAADKRCTVAQLSLACLLAQGPDVIPIPGTKHVERLEENLGALDIRLTPEEVETISRGDADLGGGVLI